MRTLQLADDRPVHRDHILARPRRDGERTKDRRNKGCQGERSQQNCPVAGDVERYQHSPTALIILLRLQPLHARHEITVALLLPPATPAIQQGFYGFDCRLGCGGCSMRLPIRTFRRCSWYGNECSHSFSYNSTTAIRTIEKRRVDEFSVQDSR